MKTELEINGQRLINIHSRTIRLNGLIVYDSVRAGKRAKELCDRLRQQLAQDSGLNLRVWSLAALRLPALAQAAASEAERAAFLIVAVNGDETLPRPIKSCLHKCARGIHAADGVLLAQLHGILKMSEEFCAAYGCLRQIANHTGGRFFSEVVELPDAELDRSLNAIHQRAHMRARVAEAVVSVPGWPGIL
jgi:hypothetical protein